MVFFGATNNRATTHWTIVAPSPQGVFNAPGNVVSSGYNRTGSRCLSTVSNCNVYHFIKSVLYHAFCLSLPLYLTLFSSLCISLVLSISQFLYPFHLPPYFSRRLSYVSHLPRLTITKCLQYRQHLSLVSGSVSCTNTERIYFVLCRLLW